ncbi:family 10 glycosylhydrolase [Bacteroidales bacterium OttesenSCG-928-M11]|nr:family 10 glycosylhydrolase [Bacteroidales bacterium OttesenSCG-928-M11]
MKRTLLFIWVLSLISHLSLFGQSKTEIRAAWLATNFRIDWPSKAFMNSDDINNQMDEFINILDKLKEANINMIFLQTRFQGSVIYRSEIEPMSSYIAGVENTWSKYDPLKFAIDECHKRGIECHTWFVTYNLGSKDKPSETTTKNFDLIKAGEKEYWLNPGDLRTNKYILSLVKELVSNYDIDGLHLDYIRYPAEATDFPDEDTFLQYGNGSNKADWRRENINRLISQIHNTVKSQKPWVQISAAVVPYYTNLTETQKSHWTAMHDAFQDPEEWIKNGKIDFVVPMIYNKSSLFGAAVKDWMNRNHNRYVVAGVGTYLLNEKEAGGNWPLKEISDQIKLVRDNNMHGVAFYSTKTLVNNQKGLFNELKKNQFDNPALLLPLNWLSQSIPATPNRPKIMPAGDYLFVKWDEVKAPHVSRLFYNVYRSTESPVDITNPKNLVDTRIEGTSLFLPTHDKNGYYYVVTSYDRYHNESLPSKEIFYRP